MKDMLISGLLPGIVAGLASGLYTGLVMTRFSRFVQARQDVWMRINRFETLGKRTPNEDDAVDLLFFSNLFYNLKHPEAGEAVRNIHQEVRHCVDLLERQAISSKELGEYSKKWLFMARTLHYSKWTIWKLSFAL